MTYRRPPTLPPGWVSVEESIVAAGSFAVRAHELRVIEAVDADDRAWLAAHPDRPYRLRPTLDGEIPAEAATELSWDLGVGPGEAWFTVVARGPSPGTVVREFAVYPLPVPGGVRLDPIEVDDAGRPARSRMRLVPGGER